MRILLTEDDDLVRAFVSRALELDGHEVETACHGVEALDRLTENDGGYDLLVTDVKMPLMDGIALAHEAAGHWPGLPILLMTGFADQRERAEDLATSHPRRGDQALHAAADPRGGERSGGGRASGRGEGGLSNAGATLPAVITGRYFEEFRRPTCDGRSPHGPDYGRRIGASDCIDAEPRSSSRGPARWKSRSNHPGWPVTFSSS